MSLSKRNDTVSQRYPRQTLITTLERLSLRILRKPIPTSNHGRRFSFICHSDDILIINTLIINTLCRPTMFREWLALFFVAWNEDRN